MKHVLFVLLLWAGAARAHFVWLIPQGVEDKPARVVFSESPDPDSPELMKRISQTKVYSLSEKGKTQPLDYTLRGAAFEVKGKADALIAVCEYGVLTRGESEPFLLRYFAKTGSPSATSDKMDLDIVLSPENPGQGTVRWKGKPVAEAEVIIHPPEGRRVKTATDAKGQFEMPTTAKPGMFALRARHIEKKAGSPSAAKYREVRSYATLTFLKDKPAGEKKEDPAASALLEQARKARAEWEKFPGFTAQLEVRTGSEAVTGSITVTGSGRVTLQNFEEGELRTELQRQLRSLVGHRVARSGSYNTPCAFADEDKDHPLGRKILVLNDELHSSYRIRGKEIIEVNRTMGPSRFTITVLENHVTPEKKYLPASYVVSTWDGKSGALKSNVAFHNEWQRVEGFDLPKSVLVVTADDQGGLHARKLTFSKWKLGAE